MRLLSIMLFLVIPAGLLSQSRHEQKADEFFARFDYARALELYHKTIKQQGPTYVVAKRVADCYRFLQMPEKAIGWYRKALSLPGHGPESFLRLGQLLRKLELYDESAIYLSRFYELAHPQAGFNGLSPGDHLRSLQSLAIQVEITPLNINTPYSELAPTIWNNKLVFMSNRPRNAVTKRKDIRHGEGFFDLYSSSIQGLYSFDQPRLLDRHLNSSLNDGPVSFSASGRQAYITRNTSSRGRSSSELDVLVANLEGQQWSRTLLTLPFRVRGHSVAHPATIPDDTGLYFASDMPGGYGGMDIYFSERRNGFLSKPVNLGPYVNTPGNEVFPHVDQQGRLFFASDGHPGLGGLDIYISLPTPWGYTLPVNIGTGINSPADDFSITLAQDGKSGYFASNRENNDEKRFGNDDIYAFQLQNPLEFTVVTGIVNDKENGNPLEEVTIDISTISEVPVAILTTGIDGRFMIPVRNNSEHVIKFTRADKQNTSKTITPVMMNGQSFLQVEIYMEPK